MQSYVSSEFFGCARATDWSKPNAVKMSTETERMEPAAGLQAAATEAGEEAEEASEEDGRIQGP